MSSLRDFWLRLILFSTNIPSLRDFCPEFPILCLTPMRNFGAKSKGLSNQTWNLGFFSWDLSLGIWNLEFGISKTLKLFSPRNPQLCIKLCFSIACCMEFMHFKKYAVHCFLIMTLVKVGIGKDLRTDTCKVF